MQAKRGLHQCLSFQSPGHEAQNDRSMPYEKSADCSPNSEHGSTLTGITPPRKPRSRLHGFMLVEATLSLTILTVVGLVMLKLSLNILQPRQWTLRQTLTDAYMSYERAYAERLPFDSLLANDSPWPAFPQTSQLDVEIGRLPGGIPVMGKIVRTRLADSNNHPVDGGAVTQQTATINNPARMKIWEVQSVLTYRIGNRPYVKSRTVIRSQ